MTRSNVAPLPATRDDALREQERHDFQVSRRQEEGEAQGAAQSGARRQDLLSEGIGGSLESGTGGNQQVLTQVAIPERETWYGIPRRNAQKDKLVRTVMRLAFLGAVNEVV